MNTNIKFSVLYILLDVASKGGSHVLLLLIAWLIGDAYYLKIMLLISLETLLPVFILSYYNEHLYNIIDKYKKKDILSLLTLIAVITCCLYIVLVVTARATLYDYFDYDRIWVYIVIPINAFFLVYIGFVSAYEQINENHASVMRIRAVSAVFAFLGTLFGVIVSPDKVAGFFIGKFVGYLVYMVIAAKPVWFSMNIFGSTSTIIREIGKRSTRMIVIGLLGWLSGYGFINLVKWYDADQAIQIAYFINVSLISLLVLNGIMQVHAPLIRKFPERYYFFIMPNYLAFLIFVTILLSNYLIHDIFQSFMLTIVINLLFGFIFGLGNNVASMLLVVGDKYNKLLAYKTVPDILYYLAVFPLFMVYNDNIVMVYVLLRFIRYVFLSYAVRSSPQKVSGV